MVIYIYLAPRQGQKPPGIKVFFFPMLHAKFQDHRTSGSGEDFNGVIIIL